MSSIKVIDLRAIKSKYIPNNIPANPVNDSNTITVKLSPLFSVPKTTPMKNITSVHCKNTMTDCVNICAINNSGVVIPNKTE